MDRNTKHLIALATSDYERHLKFLTKDVWKAVTVDHGTEVWVKMLGPKQEDDTSKPQLIVKVEAAPDGSFSQREIYQDGQGVEHKVKEIKGVSLESILDPNVFLSWVPTYLETVRRIKRPKTRDAKRLDKTARRAKAHEEIRELNSQLALVVEDRLLDQVQPDVLVEDILEEALKRKKPGRFKKMIRSTVRTAKKARRLFNRTKKAYKKANKSFVKGQKTLNRSAKPKIKAFKKTAKQKFKQIKKDYKAFKKERKAASKLKLKNKKIAAKEKKGLAVGTRRKREKGIFKKQSDGTWEKQA